MNNQFDISSLMLKIAFNPYCLNLLTDILSQMHEIRESPELQILFKKYPKFKKNSTELLKIILE